MEKVCGNYEKNVKEIRKEFPGALVFDISKDGAMGYLSPQGPWGNVDVPGMEGRSGLSVLGIWEGLKVFERKGMDGNYFYDERKLGMVRKCKSYGRWIGVRYGDELLEKDEGIEKVFKRMYRKEVMKRYGKVIEGMRELVKKRDVVFLEGSEEKLKAPCSVGEILKSMILDRQ